MTNQIADGELITRYVKKQDEGAIRMLVQRYHHDLHSRFLRELRNEADAFDLQQKLWLQVTRNLGSYKDEGKFAHYLSRIASNQLNDFWRSKGRRSEVFVENRSTAGDQDDGDSEHWAVSNTGDGSPDEEQRLIESELVEYLVTVLIPGLPVDQRIAWLLRHESEYWEPGRRLDWNHLADLNGMDVDQAWESFETAREKLLTGSGQGGQDLSEDELGIFMIWTQAQRARKEQQFTWEYFSALLGVPTNTMKTRYRTAQKQLAAGLKARGQ